MFRQIFQLNQKSAIWKVLNEAALNGKGRRRAIECGPGGSGCPQTVIVAFDAIASKQMMTDHAVEWALKNALQPGDSVILLAILPPPTPFHSFFKAHPGLGKLLTWLRGERACNGATTQEGIADYCSQLLHRLNTIKVSSEVKILAVAGKGTVAKEAEKQCASWVILDRRLMKEGEFCAKSLRCNVVVVDYLVSRFLRLNLKHSQGVHALPFEEAIDSSSLIFPGLGTAQTANLTTTKDLLFGKTINEYPENDRLSSSLGLDTSITQPSGNSYAASSSDQNMLYLQHKPTNEVFDNYKPPSQGNVLSGWHFAEGENLRLESTSSNYALREMNKPVQKVQLKMRKRFQNMASVEPCINTHKKSPQRAMSLCSICQQRAPAFGQLPRMFSYKDLEYATNGFSQTNILAEGGYGPVYKGTLPDGQVVAVKQHKLASRQQGPSEFYAEVEILSSAQHKNVVRLIGYCSEGGKWFLVYEFACNGSLDGHLYGVGGATLLNWKSRQKVAVGVAKGLRYLHEECRGGCIIHRDLRPSHILLTHDFEAMVGDFGLARWQPDGQSAEETRIIGTLGYLAPEYTQTGQITEKADVFSFGVILLEMLSGKKAIDICRNRGQRRLSEWARPILEKRMSSGELVDPHLENRFSEHELQCMMYAASVCIDEDPKSRPRMSQVLRILELGDEKLCSFITPSTGETRLASQNSNSRDTECQAVISNTNKTLCTGRLVHGQNVSLDCPSTDNGPGVDYSPVPQRSRIYHQGISDNSTRSIPPACFTNRSITSATQSLGHNKDMPSLPIKSGRHQTEKHEDHTGSPIAKTTKKDGNNCILTSETSKSNKGLSRDLFKMIRTESTSSC